MDSLCVRAPAAAMTSYSSNGYLPSGNVGVTTVPFSECVEILYNTDLQLFWKKDSERSCATKIANVFFSFIECVFGKPETKEVNSEPKATKDFSQQVVELKEVRIDSDSICQLLSPSSRIGRQDMPINVHFESLEEIPPYFEKIAAEFCESYNFQNALFKLASRKYMTKSSVNYIVDLKIDRRKVILSVDFTFYSKKDNPDVLDIHNVTASIGGIAHIDVISSDTVSDLSEEEMAMLISAGTASFKQRGMKVLIDTRNTDYVPIVL